jgi:restriction system protein
MNANRQIKIRGIHMREHVGTRPIDEGYVAIGWHELGELQKYPDRDAFKAAVAEKMPGAKTAAEPVYARILKRFTREI